MGEHFTTDGPPGEASAAGRPNWTRKPWEVAIEAVRAGDTDAAVAAIDDAVVRWRSLQDYSINWITSLLSFIGREMGEEAVEQALRRTGEEFVRPRRGEPGRWQDLPAEVRARAVTRAMVANFAEVTVAEDPDAIRLSFRCGTGGRMIDEGRYESAPGAGDGYLVLGTAGPQTFGRDRLPVYCAHCSINNELQPMEWDGWPTTVEEPPSAPGEPCVHTVYRDRADIPDEVWVRLGRRRPEPED